MADNIAITPGTGAIVGTETATVNSIAVQLQQMKIALGAREAYIASLSGRDASGSGDGALFVDPRCKAVSVPQTPTITASSAYTAKSAVGGLLDFGNMARQSGGSICLASAVLIDKSTQSATLDLVLFDRAITAPTDHSTWSPSNSDLVHCVGKITFSGGGYSVFNANEVCTISNLALEMVLNGTDLFGVLVARSTPTYGTTADLTVVLTAIQD